MWRRWKACCGWNRTERRSQRSPLARLYSAPARNWGCEEGTLGGSASQALRLRALPLGIPLFGPRSRPKDGARLDGGKRQPGGAGNGRQPCELLAEGEGEWKCAGAERCRAVWPEALRSAVSLRSSPAGPQARREVRFSEKNRRRASPSDGYRHAAENGMPMGMSLSRFRRYTRAKSGSWSSALRPTSTLSRVRLRSSGTGFSATSKR